MIKNPKLITIYQKLYEAFGPQNWWPGKNSFEIIIGAILTQNTAWSNVEKAIKNLKKERLLSSSKLRNIPIEKLAKMIRPAGYFNKKAKKLKEFIDFFFNNYEGDLDKMFKKEMYLLRQELLKIRGIGRETADSILLYAGSKPIFVIDAYTRRILFRHQLITENMDYEKIQYFFMHNLPQDVKLFNEFHALFVRLGKHFCKKTKPLFNQCPLEEKNSRFTNTP